MPDSGGSRFRRLFRPQGHPVKADFQAKQARASLLDEAGMTEVEALAEQREHIRAIERIRDLTDLSLRDSKRIYESVWR